MDEQQIMFSLGSLEGWVEKIGVMFQVDTTKPLGHVKLLEGEFKRFLANKQPAPVQTPKRERRTLEEIEAEGEQG